MIRFYFQNGSFNGEHASYGIEFLIAFIASFIGIAGAYAIYIISIRQTKKDRLKYVATLLDSIIPSAKRQAGYCNEQATLTNEKPLEMPRLKLEANRDFNRLADKIDQEVVYHAFLWKYSRTTESYRNFKSIYGYIDYLDYLINSLISFNEKTNYTIWERKKEYANSFQKAKEKIELITFDKEFESDRPAYVIFLKEALESFGTHNPKGENIAISYDYLIKPVRTYIVKHETVTSQNTELMFVLNEITNQYKGLEMASQHAAIDYNDYGNRLSKAASDLEKATERIRKDYSI